MKKTLILMIVASLLIMILSGCTTNNQQDTGATPFIGGTTGLLISLAEGTPPEEVYDGGEYNFDVVVKLKNDGETLVSKDDAIVRLSGVDPTEFSLTSADMKKYLTEDVIERKKDAEGKTMEGTPVYVEFQNFKFKNNVSGPIPYTIRADVCYKYGTVANVKLCVKKNLLEVDEDELCSVKEEKSVYNSGAPVQVTYFYEEATSPDKMRFTFKVEHKGNGKVYQLTSACDHQRKFENRVFVNVDTGITGLSCSGLTEGLDSKSGYMTLYEGEKTVICTQPITDPADYEKVTRIDLSYMYEDDTSTQVVVKNT
jgi:hypothetical protein